MSLSPFASCSSKSSPRVLKVKFFAVEQKNNPTIRCEEVVLLKDIGAIAELSSSHCFWNNRRISLFAGVFSLLKYFSKIVFLSIGEVLSVTIADVRAHHIICAGLYSLTIHLRLHLQNGITVMLQFSCVFALSYSVSCSRAYSHRCFPKDEKCWMDLMHPTSGQYNSPLSFSQVLSSLSFFLAEAFANSVVFLFFIFFFFRASSSFDGLKRNVGNGIICILD